MTSDPTRALLEAIEDDRPEDVARLVAAGADPNALDPDEEQPFLFRAIDVGGAPLVAALLDAGADVRAENDIGWTALTVACIGASQEGAAAKVELLLARGADPRHPDGEGTPLTRALDTEMTDRAITPEMEKVVRALVRAGADVDAPRDDGWTPLMLAAAAGSVALVRLLLDTGADVTAAKGDGAERVDAVSVAEHWGHADVIALLRARGASDPVARDEATLAEHWGAVASWLAEHAKPAAEALAGATGASDAAIDALEQTLGARLPGDFRAELRLHGGAGGAPHFEYASLAVEMIARRWKGLRDLAAKGTFEGAEPHELRQGEPRVKRVWWDAGWIPFAEDGGGNLLCVDLAPGEIGARGQVIGWEVQGGPTSPRAASFVAYLEKYREAITSGRYAYDAASGIFGER